MVWVFVHFTTFVCASLPHVFFPLSLSPKSMGFLFAPVRASDVCRPWRAHPTLLLLADTQIAADIPWWPYRWKARTPALVKQRGGGGQGLWGSKVNLQSHVWGLICCLSVLCGSHHTHSRKRQEKVAGAGPALILSLDSTTSLTDIITGLTYNTHTHAHCHTAWRQLRRFTCVSWLPLTPASWPGTLPNPFLFSFFFFPSPVHCSDVVQKHLWIGFRFLYVKKLK